MCVFCKTQHSFTLLHIPLLALTDGQMTEERINPGWAG
jgi:hypothetical protein